MGSDQLPSPHAAVQVATVANDVDGAFRSSYSGCLLKIWTSEIAPWSVPAGRPVTHSRT